MLIAPAHTDHWQIAAELRNLAMRHTTAPRYLLAYEICALLNFMPDLQQRFLIDTLWNTGARINEALALTATSFELDGSRAFVVLRTLKQRQRGRGRPRRDEALNRLVPLLDPLYAQRAREFIASFRPKAGGCLWPVTDQTVRNWLKAAQERAAQAGLHFPMPVTPHVFRHSFAMHLLLQGNLHIKRLQAYLGHRSLRSTEVYTQVLALDAVASEIGLSFTVPLTQNPLLPGLQLLGLGSLQTEAQRQHSIAG